MSSINEESVKKKPVMCGGCGGKDKNFSKIIHKLKKSFLRQNLREAHHGNQGVRTPIEIIDDSFNCISENILPVCRRCLQKSVM